LSKRLFDLVASFLGLLVLAPVLLGIAIWVKLDSPGPVFFRQVRVGRHGVPFRIFKFRTMGVDAEREGKLTVGADRRVTRSGRFLRRYKLDELPQLFDVLRGTMSLVGPRPEVPEYVNRYPTEIRQLVLSVKPGLTDHASLALLDESEMLAQYEDPEEAYVRVLLPKKLAMYCDYVRTRSFSADLAIVWKTLLRIVFRGG